MDVSHALKRALKRVSFGEIYISMPVMRVAQPYTSQGKVSAVTGSLSEWVFDVVRSDTEHLTQDRSRDCTETVPGDLILMRHCFSSRSMSAHLAFLSPPGRTKSKGARRMAHHVPS
jgi:hypothetical protein